MRASIALRVAGGGSGRPSALQPAGPQARRSLRLKGQRLARSRRGVGLHGRAERSPRSGRVRPPGPAAQAAYRPNASPGPVPGATGPALVLRAYDVRRNRQRLLVPAGRGSGGPTAANAGQSVCLRPNRFSRYHPVAQNTRRRGSPRMPMWARRQPAPKRSYSASVPGPDAFCQTPRRPVRRLSSIHFLWSLTRVAARIHPARGVSPPPPSMSGRQPSSGGRPTPVPSSPQVLVGGRGATPAT